ESAILHCLATTVEQKCPGSSLRAAEQLIAQDGALALHADDSAGPERVAMAQPGVGRRGDEDAAWRGVGFHPVGQVDGVAPQVISEFLRTDDSRHDRPG